MHWKLPSQPQTYALLCFLETSTGAFISTEGKNVALSSGSSLCIISPNPMLLCGHTLLVLRFPEVFFPQTWARKDFAHEVHFFEQRLEMALCFPEFEFRTTCVLRILWCVPRRSVQSRLPSFPKNRLLWIWIFEIHNLGPFFSSRIATAPWVLFFDFLLGFSSP